MKHHETKHCPLNSGATDTPKCKQYVHTSYEVFNLERSLIKDFHLSRFDRFFASESAFGRSSGRCKNWRSWLRIPSTGWFTRIKELWDGFPLVSILGNPEAKKDKEGPELLRPGPLF